MPTPLLDLVELKKEVYEGLSIFVAADMHLFSRISDRNIISVLALHIAVTFRAVALLLADTLRLLQFCVDIERLTFLFKTGRLGAGA